MARSTIRRFAAAAAATAACGSCGGNGAAPAKEATPALAASGATAQTIHYRCQAGRQDTIVVSLPDLRQLAEVLNPINVCEYDGGLAEVMVTAACSARGAAQEVRIVAVSGQLPASSAKTICG